MFRGFKSYTIRHINRGLAQSGSAPALGAGGRVFKSLNPDHNGSVAQRLELRAHNALVVGSIPTWPTNFLRMGRIAAIAADCKSVARKGFAGSSPAPSTKKFLKDVKKFLTDISNADITDYIKSR